MNRLQHPLLPLFILSIALAHLSCSAPRNYQTAQSRTVPPVASPENQEVARLYDELRHAQTKISNYTNPDPASQSVETENKSTNAGYDFSGQDVASASSCEEVCTLKENICKNADRICELAKEMEEGKSKEWAQTKCTESNETCDQARVRCKNCE